jgi:peptide/nickel transport system substrate-binding protein
MISNVNRRRFLAGTAGAALAAGLDARSGAQAQGAAGGPRPNITVRVASELTNLDPGFRTGPVEGNVIRSMYQRLLKQKANSAELELDAAAEVTQVSPTQVDFRLKPGQMFTDGFGEMTAEDVKFSFERIGLPPTDGSRPSPYRGDWIGLDRVEVTGQYTGRIILSQPRANLLDIGIGDVSGCIVSRRAVQQRGAEYATRPVGSGPYVFANYERQRGATLRRNAAFAGARPAFDEIAIRTITDPRTTDLALRSGEIDFAVLAPAVAEPLRQVQGLTVAEQPSISYLWVGMNLEKPPLNDIRVRQALRLGLDVDQMLIAGYNGRAPRLNTVLPPQILGHWREAPVYRRNVAEARRLLAAAGANNLRLRLTILNQPAFQNMALVARALLQEIGVTIEVDAQEGGTFWNAGQGDTGRNLDLFLLRFNGKHDPNFIMQWFVSGQIGTWNWQRWNNPEFDRLFAASSSELDRARRLEQVTRMQQLMDESSAFVWLTNEVNALVHRSWLRPSAVPGWLDWQYDSFAMA